MTVVTNPACTDPRVEPRLPVECPDSQAAQASTSGTQPRTGSYGIGPYGDIIRIDVGTFGDIQMDENARLYDNEKQSDVTFVAGINGDTFRFPGHRRVLQATSPVFAALLTSKADVIVVDYIDRRGFEQLLRYYYCEPTHLTSIHTARATLYAAYKFLCPPLAERCARRLDEMLDANSAIEILLDLRFLCERLPGAASAPPLPDEENDENARALSQCAIWCDSLAHNALLVIDANADAALTHEKFDDLAYEDISLIVRRDTLRVSSELVLADALARWSVAACKRAKRELTPANKRLALGELAYCPRYLLLKGEDLDKALALELLEPVERSLVLARARKQPAPIPVGVEQEAMLRRWAQRRPTKPATGSVLLSSRSEAMEEARATKLCGCTLKKLKEPSFAPEKHKPPKDNCCMDCFYGLVQALICLLE